MAGANSLTNPLAFRLARYSVLLAFCIGLILSSAQLLFDYRGQQQLIDQQIQQILIVSSPPATQAVTTLDKKLAKEVVDGLLKYPYIEQAEIIDELGESLARAQHSPGPSDTLWLTRLLGPPSKNYLHLIQSKQYAWLEPGKLLVDVNLDRALSPLYERSIVIILSGVARNILLIILLLVIFHLVLTQPLKRLALQFSSFSHKPLSPSDSPPTINVAPVHKHNELGLICDSGNQFLQSMTRLLTEREQSQQALEKTELRLLKLIDHLPQMIVAQNSDGKILFSNQEFANFYRQDITNICHQSMSALHRHAPEETDKIEAIRQAVLSGQKVTNLNELSMTDINGEKHYFSAQVASFDYFNEPATLIVASDITEQRNIQQHVVRMASHDSLTGLPNRMLLNDRLSLAIANCHRHHQHNALLFLDLDHFKTINDSLGHIVGDELLIEVAKRLQQLVRKNDTVARLGGDEFVILLSDLPEDGATSKQRVSAICDKLLAQLSQPFFIYKRDLHVGVSIGVVMFPMAQATQTDLLRYADTAMYQAKAKGRGQTVFYQQTMSTAVEQRQDLESQLYRALKNNEFRIHYQAKVDDSGGLIGFEALIRWQHPTRDLVPPGEFIHLLESSGQIIPVSQWLLRQCCEQIKQWRQAGFWQPHWHLAINISPRYFYHNEFIHTLDSSIKDADIPHDDVCVEITESLALDNITLASRLLKKIKALGVTIAMDDFGTGYSSLSYLKDLPVDILKIDRSFIMDLALDARQNSIVEAIIAMAKVLELTVVAEGVETEIQLDTLKDLDCSCFQGFLFHRPEPPDAIEARYQHSGTPGE